MANPYRGEVAISIDGERRTMRLTLGALCELEERLESGSLVALVERFEQGAVRARDVLALICAGLRGGGSPVTEAELGAMCIDGGPVVAAQAAAELLRVTFALPGEAGHG
ncbi:MAG TPA: gene transfer agent family protein [Paracoccaceae bacterium]|nr:gene transfer agent family protein [Paracoccaceae bacterium]